MGFTELFQKERMKKQLTKEEKDKAITTHVQDGGREGVYSLLLTGICAKIVFVVPELYHIAAPEVEIAGLMFFATGFVKFCRNLIRKNLGVHLKGII